MAFDGATPSDRWKTDFPVLKLVGYIPLAFPPIQESFMSEESKPSAEINGGLWSSRAMEWAEFQEHQCRPVYEAVLEKLQVRSGVEYLDVGCGAGLAALLASERGARVSGFDASAAMLHIARIRLPQSRIEEGDLETLPFADDSFDAVSGFNSFQYATNPGKALAEARRVARKGGLVAIVTWGPPEGMPAASLVAALRPLMPSPPPGTPGPFALSDEAALRGFAEGAGLQPLELFDVECPFTYATLQDGIHGLGSSGVAERARKNSSEEAVDQTHAKALSAFRQPDGSYRVAAIFRCLVARA
jgi:SAM-dependent methyltransferase